MPSASSPATPVSEIRSEKPFGHRTNPRKMIFHYEQNPTILRSFGPKSDDFKISEVGDVMGMGNISEKIMKIKSNIGRKGSLNIKNIIKNTARKRR